MGKMADRCYLQKRVLNRSKVSSTLSCHHSASHTPSENHTHRALPIPTLFDPLTSDNMAPRSGHNSAPTNE